MEAIFLILIGAALYSQSWYVLGMYSEGRTMAVFVGGLGLLSLATIMFEPTLIGSDLVRASDPSADLLTEITVMKALIAMWAVYAVGVAAHGLWDFDERAIGFYSGFLTVGSLVAFLYFVLNLQLAGYDDTVWLGLSAAGLVLTALAGIAFFYLAFGFVVLRLVAGWFMLLGGSAVGAIGLAIMSAAISQPPVAP